MQLIPLLAEDLRVARVPGNGMFDSVSPQKFTVLIPTEKLAQLSQLANCDN